jgi:hypothetical protein
LGAKLKTLEAKVKKIQIRFEHYKPKWNIKTDILELEQESNRWWTIWSCYFYQGSSDYTEKKCSYFITEKFRRRGTQISIHFTIRVKEVVSRQTQNN